MMQNVSNNLDGEVNIAGLLSLRYSRRIFIGIFCKFLFHLYSTLSGNFDFVLWVHNNNSLKVEILFQGKRNEDGHSLDSRI